MNSIYLFSYPYKIYMLHLLLKYSLITYSIFMFYKFVSRILEYNGG